MNDEVLNETVDETSSPKKAENVTCPEIESDSVEVLPSNAQKNHFTMRQIAMVIGISYTSVCARKNELKLTPDIVRKNQGKPDTILFSADKANMITATFKKANQIDFNCITTNDTEELLGETNDEFPKANEAKEQNLNEAKFDTKGVNKDIKDVEIDYLKQQVADKQKIIDSLADNNLFLNKIIKRHEEQLNEQGKILNELSDILVELKSNQKMLMHNNGTEQLAIGQRSFNSEESYPKEFDDSRPEEKNHSYEENSQMETKKKRGIFAIFSRKK